MTPLERSIDALYKLPLADFVGARTQLAKTLSGDDAKTVKALVKPTVIPWAVNQVYWHDRRVYDRVIAAGERLRRSQIAVLEGGAAKDVRAATEANREAVAQAVKVALQLASAHGVRPQGDTLTQMFGALSAMSVTSVTKATPPQSPGRFTAILAQPTGFAALEGLTIKAQPHEPVGTPSLAKAPRATDVLPLERERAAAERRAHAAAVAKAQAEVEQARAIEATAQEAWAAAKNAREEAERTLRRVTVKS